jgi:type II secretory ATPase GspE/PulE/Tfp pilus assembly ATPase PilB-like protein
MCADHSAVATAAEMILNQRLIRRLCPGCQGKGCEICLRTGYQGRAPVLEWLRVDDAMRARIRRGELTAIAPLRALEESARELLQRGLSNEAEYRRVFGL